MNKSESTLKHWSFVFFITAVCLNIIISILVVKTTLFLSFGLPIAIFSLMTFGFSVIGIVVGAISIIKKENNDYKQLFGVLGNAALLIIGIISQ